MGEETCLTDSGNGGGCLFWQQVGEHVGCSESVVHMHDLSYSFIMHMAESGGGRNVVSGADLFCPSGHGVKKILRPVLPLGCES